MMLLKLYMTRKMGAKMKETNKYDVFDALETVLAYVVAKIVRLVGYIFMLNPILASVTTVWGIYAIIWFLIQK